jgi:hypothetical protein
VQFPDDVDGDVLRRLEKAGLDFSRPQTVDFNIDFNCWPPATEALNILRAKYGSIEVVEPEENYSGYVLIQAQALVNYPFVAGTQKETTTLMSKFGGVCESWGVLC